jgi:hypothetical protein
MPDTREHLPYLRHKNGNGRIFDISEVCERSFLDRSSFVQKESSVWLSKITGSQISGSIISNSVIRDSWIENSDIRGGHIVSSVVACELIVGNPRITRSQILGRTRIAHTTQIDNCRFRDLTVFGSAVLQNWPDESFDGCQGYISRGLWKRPPRVKRLAWDVTLTESVPGFAYVGCREHSIQHWFVAGDRIGRAQGWSYSQIDEVRRFLEDLVSHQIPM